MTHAPTPPPAPATPRRLALIEAPSPLGLRPPSAGHVPGVRFMPRALREAGLWSAVPVAHVVTLSEPAYRPEVDPATGIRNLEEMVCFTRQIEAAVSVALEAGETPLVIGGDCSVLLGPALALRKRSRCRLVHLDGHSDFAHDGNVGKPYPSIAGAALAVVTGRGSPALTDLDGLRPYFRDEDVLQFGAKAEPGTPDWLEDFAQTQIARIPLSAVHAEGITAALARASRWLEAAPGSGFWLHVDVDVLDPVHLPAVDSPDPGGLDWSEFETTVRTFLHHPHLIGANIGIYDTELDPDRRYARRIADLLARVLRSIAAAGR